MKRVFIIGAGPAGITAGLELLKRSKEYQVTILEESNEVGGISRTVRYHGNRMDIGGHRFFSKDERVTDWWQQMMPMQGKPSYDDLRVGRDLGYAPGGPDPEREDRVMLKRNRVSRIYYGGKFFDYPVSMNANTIKNMGFATTMSAGFSYLYSLIAKREETSLENFYINKFGKKLYAMFFEGYTEKLWGRHPRDISADWGAQRVKGLSIITIIQHMLGKVLPGSKHQKVETSLIEEFSYPKYGPGQLWEIAADEFVALGGELKKSCKVCGLHKTDRAVKSIVYDTPEGQIEEEADIVISTMPLKDLVAGMENVPKQIQDIAQGLPYRDFVTVGLLLSKLNLKNETKLKTLHNIIPDCWIYVQDVGVKLGRIQIFNNWSCYMVKKPEETIWIGLEYFCNEGDSYWNMDDEAWSRMGIKELVSMGVIDGEDVVLDSHCERVKKAYPAYFDTYARIDELVQYLNGIDNLYCIGRNGQHRYNNMDHSMATAFEAVNNIVEGITDKTAIWSVNTEKEYHEEKNEEHAKSVGA